MTATHEVTLPAYLATLIDTARPPCDARDDEYRCTEPAAWIVTITTRCSGSVVTLLHCVDHMAALNEHLHRCAWHRSAYDVKAVEL